MTIIVYSKGQLAGDRMGVVGVGRSAPLQETVKVFKSECGRFAYGITGDTLTETERLDLMPLVFRTILVHNVTDGSVDMELTPEDATALDMASRSIMVMTHARAWRINMRKFIEITNLDGYCSGNGCVMGDICIKFGLSAEGTVKEVSALQQDCGLGLDVVNASDLIPLFDPEGKDDE